MEPPWSHQQLPRTLPSHSGKRRTRTPNLRDNVIVGLGVNSAIILSGSSLADIAHNEISDFQFGILMHGPGGNSSVSNNTIDNVEVGVRFSFSDLSGEGATGYTAIHDVFTNTVLDYFLDGSTQDNKIRSMRLTSWCVLGHRHG